MHRAEIHPHKETIMALTEKEPQTFHNTNAVLRIALWTNIVAWIILALTLITFGNQVYSIVTNWASISVSLPPALFDRISAFASLFLDSLLAGVFYFLVLRGVSAGLNLGLDIFCNNDKDESVEANASLDVAG
jgi:hypothetical protein